MGESVAARRPPAGDGSFVRLSAGVTHYRVEGPPDGKPILLVHGATVPHWEFDLLAPHLVASGHRVLRFDLFGHGLSDRPAARYTLDLFAAQATELLEATGFPAPATVLGHSMGAAIAACAASARPGRVGRLVLVAPMLGFSAQPWTAALRCPVLGELLMRFLGVPALIRRRRRRYARIGQPALTRRFIEQASRDGYWQALLSMARCGTLDNQAARYAALATHGAGIVVISGGADTVVPPRDVEQVRACLPPHRHVQIEGAGHNVLLTHAGRIAAELPD